MNKSPDGTATLSTLQFSISSDLESQLNQLPLSLFEKVINKSELDVALVAKDVVREALRLGVRDARIHYGNAKSAKQLTDYVGVVESALENSGIIVGANASYRVDLSWLLEIMYAGKLHESLWEYGIK